MDRQPVRGFVTLSTSLGSCVIWVHKALLTALKQESDVLTQSTILRALCTLLVGSPYHRLPPELLPTCVEELASFMLQLQSLGLLTQNLNGNLKTTTNQNNNKAAAAVVVQTVPAEQFTLLCGVLSALAAAFSSKPPSDTLLAWLQGNNTSQNINNSGDGNLKDVLLHCASLETDAYLSVELESTMALRGLAQQFFTALDCHNDLTRIIASAVHGIKRVDDLQARGNFKQQQGGYNISEISNVSV